MAINQHNQQRVDPKAYLNPQIFLAYGPVPEQSSHLMAVRSFIRRHILLTIICAASSLFLLENLWAWWGYPGAHTLLSWRFELSAVGLLFLTGRLFFAFWQWGKERIVRAPEQPERGEEVNPMHCPPPSLPAPVGLSVKRRDAIKIEYWASHEPTLWSEENLKMAELPDDFLAPDTLVLSIKF